MSDNQQQCAPRIGSTGSRLVGQSVSSFKKVRTCDRCTFVCNVRIMRDGITVTPVRGINNLGTNISMRDP